MNIIIVRYFAIINVITLALFGVDKWRASRHQYRISERQLYVMIGLGGVIGALIGMQLFRHKTSKLSFLLIAGGVMLLWIIVGFIIILSN